MNDLSKDSAQRDIEVYADWKELERPRLIGVLHVVPGRGRDVFYFEYDRSWLATEFAQVLDPRLVLLEGPQYPAKGATNFGLFLDSAPDRWGRVLMDRREALNAREAGRQRRQLRDSDYLLGVFDGQRLGALRFKLHHNGPFLDNDEELATPPWTSLRDLEYASLQVESRDADKKRKYAEWIRMLIAPGGSLGGTRPKAGVVDPMGRLWIAKFPSRADRIDVGAWEYLVHRLAAHAGIVVEEATTRMFTEARHTFLTRRFDRDHSGSRIHVASALTLLGRQDGDNASKGASYLELAEVLVRDGANTRLDLEQLWRRIVFNICVSNCDDHLRNHAFMLGAGGWSISPAYDMNPDPYGNGLNLNISDVDNAQDLGLAREVAGFFRVDKVRSVEIIAEVVQAVCQWRAIAEEIQISDDEQDYMEPAFSVATKALRSLVR